MSSAAAPPKARPVQYKAPLGTRWEKEKAQLPKNSIDLPTDPNRIGPWILGECVGKGASGRVKVARHYETGQMAAVKILPLENILSSRYSLHTRATKAEKHRNGIDKEIVMMKLMDHPNVVRIYDVFEGERDLFLILEYVDGGELFDYLVNHGRMDRHKALYYFKQIIHGLAYSHAFAVIHRDLKPENILISSLDPPHIKIADWGMAAFSPPEHRLETSCGSPHYASPEIVRGERYLGTATDIWSCGVILFALMTGRLPFDDKSIRALLQKVKSGVYEVPTYVDKAAADLIRRMLVVNVDERITMPDILAHPFLTGPTPGVICIAPPSISQLDRPLHSTALVKQDLISQLMLICMGSSYTELVNELLSPPGQSSLIKALYFLLDKHRESTLEDYGAQSRFNADGQVIKHYAAPPLKQPPPTLSELSKYSASTDPTTTNTQTSQLGQSVVSTVPTSYMVSPVSPTASCIGSRVRPSSPNGPRSPRSTYIRKARPISTPNAQGGSDTGSDIVMSSPKSNVPPVRPSRIRAHTAEGLPLAQQRYIPSPVQGLPAGITHPGSPEANSRSSNASSFSPAVDGSALLSLERPVVEDPRLQKTLDEVERSLGQLLQERQMQRQAAIGLGLDAPGSTAPTGEDSVMAVDEHLENVGSKQLRIKDNNVRTPGADFRYSLPNKKTTSFSPHAVISVDQNKENVSIDMAVISEEDTSYTKIEKADVEMDTAVVDRRLLQRKRSKPRSRRNTTHLTHGLGTSKRAAEVTGATAPGTFTVGSPVPSGPSGTVGEVKGWFANLFNWKAQQYVLHSVDNCLATRDEAARIFHALGCHVILEDAQGWGILRCKMDEIHDPATGIVAFKSVRFRAEFSPIMGYTLGGPPVTSPAPSSSSGSSSSQSQVRNNSDPNPMHNATVSVPLPMGPPVASTVMLIQEKGALSTFKHIHAALRQEWRGAGGALRSPDLNAIAVPIAGTPRLR